MGEREKLVADAIRAVIKAKDGRPCIAPYYQRGDCYWSECWCKTLVAELARAALAALEAAGYAVRTDDPRDSLGPGELLPCPFCGGDGCRDETEDGGKFIECSTCGAATALHYDRAENLTSAWNDRAAAPQPQQQEDGDG